MRLIGSAAGQGNTKILLMINGGMNILILLSAPIYGALPARLGFAGAYGIEPLLSAPPSGSALPVLAMIGFNPALRIHESYLKPNSPLSRDGYRYSGEH
ncbi:hypothetical protein KCP69_13080 [Salmonella enterica subsp. enterica]|nr:hypothetical protein KCP69_13080 [Salmonella enterica subsp. enterica]